MLGNLDSYTQKNKGELLFSSYTKAYPGLVRLEYKIRNHKTPKKKKKVGAKYLDMNTSYDLRILYQKQCHQNRNKPVHYIKLEYFFLTKE